MHQTKRILQIIVTFLGLVLLLYIFYLTNQTLYVSPTGSDRNPGTQTKPLATIAAANRRLIFGGTIRLLPGIYREEIHLDPNRMLFQFPLVIEGTEAIITGSEPAATTTWTRCTPETCPDIPEKAIPHVVVSRWQTPRDPTIITETGPDGKIYDLPMARSPWHFADTANKTDTFLTDSTLANTLKLTGATAVVIDGGSRCGAFMYERQIIRYTPATGTMTFDVPAGAITYGIQENGIGPYTSYYVKNTPSLLDTPGEWYYNPHTQRLYLWPLTDQNPGLSSIEIGVRHIGIAVDRSNVRIRNLTIEGINDRKEGAFPDGGGIVIGTKPNEHIKNIMLSDLTLSHLGNAVRIAPPDTTEASGIWLRHLSLAHTTKSSVVMTAREPVPSNIRHVRIEQTAIRDAASEYFEAGIALTRVQDASIIGNTISDSTSFGIHVTGYENQPVVTAHIFINKNRITNVCTRQSGCSGIKFFGGPFRDTLISQNAVAHLVGHSYCDEKTNLRNGAASGIFLSNASGITVANNQLHENSAYGITAYPRQFKTTDNTIINNTISGSPVGIELTNALGEVDNNPVVYATRHDHTTIRGNIFRNDTTGIALDPAHPDTLRINANDYDRVKTDMQFRHTVLPTLRDIRNMFPQWETDSLWADIKNILSG